MDKKTKITITVCILLVVATIAGLYFYDKNAKEDKAYKKTEPDGATGSGTSTGNVSAFPLKIGSRGEKVTELQQKMNAWVAANWDRIQIKPKYQSGLNSGKEMKRISEDGVFGKNTQEFARYVYRSTSVTESQFNSAADMWADTPTHGTTSEWVEDAPFLSNDWFIQLYNEYLKY